MSLLTRYVNFWIFLGVFLLAALICLYLEPKQPTSALLIGFNCGALVFLYLLFRLFWTCSPEKMRDRAAANEPDHKVTSAIALFVVGMVLAAVWLELRGSGRNAPGGHQSAAIILAAGTLTLAWVFANAMFTLHYAHVWYLPDAKGERRGLEFPEHDQKPDYWDFAYFAFVLGMTFQVSDIIITSKTIRRTALAHSVMAFAYNIGIIAVSVGVIGDMLKK